MTTYKLTGLQYSKDRRGPFKLYIYQADGFHRGHYYGTLDTINEWDWSGYRATKRQLQAA